MDGESFLGGLGDHGLGGDQETGHGGRALDRPHGRPSRGSTMPACSMSQYSSVWALKPKVAPPLSRMRPTTIEPSTPALGGDLTDRRLESLEHDVDAGLNVRAVALDRLGGLLGEQQGDAATGDDTLFHGRAGRMESVVDAVLLLLDLDLGRTADADHRDAARELGQALLELLTVVVRGGLLDLRLDLADAALDGPPCRRHRR